MLLLPVLFLINDIQGQTFQDSVSYTSIFQNRTLLFSTYDKQLNTHNLNTGLQFQRNLGRYSFSLEENFRSTVVNSSTQNIKDENYFTFMNSYGFNSYFALGMLLKNNVYSDDRSLAINKTSLLQNTVFMKIIPYKKVLIVPYYGYSKNEQTAIIDKGSVYGSELAVQDLRIDNFNINSEMKFENEDISPRKNTMRFFDLNMLTNFDENINNNISLDYKEERNDFYIDADSLTMSDFRIAKNIQSRTEQTVKIQEQLFYAAPASKLSLIFNTDVNWKNVNRDTRYISLKNISKSSFDTQVEEFQLNLSSTANYRTDKSSTQFKITYYEKEAKYYPSEISGANSIFYEERKKVEALKNSTSQQITLTLNTTYEFSLNDQLTLSLFHRKLIYDTPSDENYDDRDELLSIIKLSYLHRVNSFFYTFTNLEGSFTRLAYIFAERSSNNNKKRYLKFSGGGVYINKYLRSSNSAEISANYTVYDYEELNASYKSYSFRQLTLKDSTQYLLTPSLKADFYGYLKLSEQGNFKWTSFSSQPVRFQKELYLEPKLVFMKSNLELGIGVRYYDLATYSYNSRNVKTLSSEYKSIGPLTEINLEMHERLMMKLNGYYEFITTVDKTKKEQTNLNIMLNWLL